MPRDESFEITDKSRVSAESEAGLEELLLRNDVEFVETHRLEPCPLMLGELLERRSPPTRQCVFKQFHRRLRVRRGVRLPAQLLETTCVDHLIGNLKHVARWTSDDLGLGPKDPSQSRKMALQNAGRVCGRVVTPQLVAQSVCRDD